MDKQKEEYVDESGNQGISGSNKMIKSIEFVNFRNLNVKYEFNENLNVIFGSNNSGKTNILDGIRLAFSPITGDYFKISKSDFTNSDDTNPIVIKVELDTNSIPSLNYKDKNSNTKCGFQVLIKKTRNGKYMKDVSLFDGSNIDMEIVRSDDKIPGIYIIPLARIEDIYTDGLITGLSRFIESEEAYRELKSQSKDSIKEQMKTKINKFQDISKKFHQHLDIALSEPRISDEKVYIVDGEKEHNYRIGSGFKSIANIILNTLNENYNIILIDEIENHLHPSLIRTLIRELRQIKNTMVIGTTHSAVVINELKMEELIDVSSKKLIDIDDENKRKLNIFLHPGRSELVLSENVILVEGYTEELLLNNYLYNGNNYNWTVVNVAGVMFAPYIELAQLLNKKVVVISDNDKAKSANFEATPRFNKLKRLCDKYNIKLIEVDNTLETDLYNNGKLDKYMDLLDNNSKHPELFVAKKNKKTEIALKLIEDKVDLSDWHIIKEIINELNSD